MKYHIYVESHFEKDTTELICKTDQTYRHQKQTNGYERGTWGASINQQLGMNTRVPLHTT